MFQPICMQMRLLTFLRKGKANKHAQSKLLNFCPFYLVFTLFLLEKHFGPLLRSYIGDVFLGEFLACKGQREQLKSHC